MPRVALRHAIATKSTIAQLWHAAEEKGSVTIRLPSKDAMFNVRNRLYAYRSQQRKAALAHTGIEACSLDNIMPTYMYLPDGKVELTLSYLGEAGVITFDLIMDDDDTSEPLPLDTFDPDEDQWAWDDTKEEWIHKS